MIRQKRKKNPKISCFLPCVYIVFPERLHRIANIAARDKLSKETPATLLGSVVLRAP
jgi:hypothetical protein